MGFSSHDPDRLRVRAISVYVVDFPRRLPKWSGDCGSLVSPIAKPEEVIGSTESTTARQLCPCTAETSQKERCERLRGTWNHVWERSGSPSDLSRDLHERRQGLDGDRP